jgi:1-acyl-sn-glycerol-3-phosphate acyltransferase
VRKRPLYRLLGTLARIFLLSFWDYRAEGTGHVPEKGGAILAACHQSHLDPVVITVALRRPVGYVARQTLFRNAFFGHLIHWLGAIPFDRDETGSGEMRGIVRMLCSGAAMIFFPEGTRTPDGEIGPLKPGIALLARRSGVPVIPVAVQGAYECWPRHRKLFRPGRIRIVFGPPVMYGPKSKRTEVLNDISERLHVLSDRAREMA